MDPETINLVAVIMLGVVSVGALIALVVGKRMNNQELVNTLAPWESIATTLAFRFDEVLALHGELLKPMYDISSAAETLIDEPTDFLRQLLPEDYTAIAQEVLKYMQSLSDGKPPEPPITSSEPASPPPPEPPIETLIDDGLSL